MKKIIILISALFITYSAISQWRICDLEIKFTSPSQYTKVKTPLDLAFTLSIKNLGPDTIYPTDTFYYTAGYDYRLSDRKTPRFAIGTKILPGDSTFVKQSIYIKISRQLDTFRLSLGKGSARMYGPPAGAYNYPLATETSEYWANNQAVLYLINTSTIGINNIFIDKVSVFPNPLLTDRILTISSLETIGKDIQILDLTGKSHSYKHISMNEGTTQLDLKSLSAGIYFLIMENKGVLTRKKLILQ